MKLGIAISFLVATTATMDFAQEQQKSSVETPAGQAPIISAIPKVGQGTQQAASADKFVTEQAEGDLLSSDLVGRALFDTAGRKLGEVSDMLIGRDRRLVAVIADLEGAESTQKKVAIPFDILRQDTSNSRETRLVISMDQSTLQAAKAFESLSREARLDDNQDLTTGSGAATGASVPPIK
jgi:hypothetical protein